MAETQITGRIYKITSSLTSGVYVGSTTRTLKEILREHNKDYKKYTNSTYPYITAFEIMKHPDATIDLLFEGNFNTKSDIFRLEGEYIQATENCINKQVAGQNYKEHKK